MLNTNQNSNWVSDLTAGKRKVQVSPIENFHLIFKVHFSRTFCVYLLIRIKNDWRKEVGGRFK